MPFVNTGPQQSVSDSCWWGLLSTSTHKPLYLLPYDQALIKENRPGTNLDWVLGLGAFFLPLEGPSGHLWPILWLISLHCSLKEFGKMFDRFIKWSQFSWQKLRKSIFEVLQIQMRTVISYYPRKFSPWLYINKRKGRYFLYQKHSSEMNFNNIPLKYSKNPFYLLVLKLNGI